jgi:hypothetical protein
MKHLIVFWVTMLLLVGCVNTVRVGELQNDKKSLPLGSAEQVDIEITMGAGMLNVAGGAGADLLNASLWYNVAEWQPIITYDELGSAGRLELRQPDIVGANWGSNTRYEWNLLFNDDVPTNLHARLGAGKSGFALWMMNLNRLTIEAGAGETVVAIPGGQVRDLEIAMGVGKLTLDVSGDWDHDLDGRIRGGLGELIVKLPTETNVAVRVDGGLGEVQSHGLTLSGDTYSRNVGSDHTVTLDISGGVGSIRLELQEGQ